MNAQERARKIWQSVKNNPVSVPFIIPEKSVHLTVVESRYDNDPEKDYAFIVSDTAYSDMVVETWIAEMSGLTEWHVVPGYPYLNKDKKIEWKVDRSKS